MILAVKNSLPKVQLLVILAVAAYFYAIGAGFAALYGGAVSLLNTLLINRHTNTQKANANISAQAGLKMLFISVIMRMTMVIGLILMGYFVLKLNSAALIIGLILGLISFLMDKVLQK